MDRPNRKRLQKIGIVLVIVSVLLFSLSVFLIYSNTAHASNVSIGPGSSYTLNMGNVSAGDDIDYSVSTNLQMFNLTTYLSYNTGASAGYVNVTNSSSVTKVIVSPDSGNVSLVIKNTGSYTINVDASIGIVDYYTLVSLVFGFVLLPSGIVILGVYYYSRYVERQKEKLLRGF